jgi:hypothetical protein
MTGTTPCLSAGEIEDLESLWGQAAFAFDPEKHPHGEHGHWAASLDAAATQWAASLSPPVRAAVKDYTGDGYVSVNRGLRQPSGPEVTEAARAIQAAVLSFPPHDPPLKTYRGLSCSSPETLAGIESGLKASLQSGGVTQLNGFSSASLDPHFAATYGKTGRGGVMLEITSPRGALIDPVSEFPGQREILHPHGDHFRVTGVRESTFADPTGKSPPVTRRVYSLEACEPPATFAFDPTKHPHGEHGHFAPTAFDPRQDFGDSPVRPDGDTELRPDKMPADMRERAKKMLDWISPNAHASLKSYVSNDFAVLNRAMRDAGGDVNKLPDTPVLAGCKDAETIRSMGKNMMEAFWAGGPQDPPLTCWRVMGGTPKRIKEFVDAAEAAQKSGAEIRMPVFGSSSLNPCFVADASDPESYPLVSPGINSFTYKKEPQHRITLEIKSRSGFWVGGTDIPFFARENELIQPPTARYKVLGWKDVKFGKHERRIMRLEELPPDPALYAGGPHDPTSGVTFAFDPEKHPHGTDGRWASGVTGSGDDVIVSDPLPPAADVATSNTWRASLSDDQKRSLGYYTLSQYYEINKDLRDHPGDPVDVNHEGGQRVANLDAAIRAYPERATPATSYRGITTSQQLTPDARAQIAKIQGGLQAALESGATVTMNGFTSASMSPKVAAEWALTIDDESSGVVLEIKSKRGAFLGKASSRPEEQEVLHTHGERFKVTGVRDQKFQIGWKNNKSCRTYTLEAVAEPPPPLKINNEFPFTDAAFGDFNPDLHPRDEAGRWASDMAAAGHPHFKEYKKGEVRTASEKDIPPQLVEAAKKWSSQLSTTEKNAFKWYTVNGYEDLNKKLRKNPDPDRLAKPVRKKAADMAAAIERFPQFAHPITVWRGLDCHSPEKQAKIEASLKDAIASGATVRMAGFTSASLSPTMAKTFTKFDDSVMLEIHTPIGAYISPASEMGREHEFLMSHNTAFKVREVHHNVELERPDGTRLTTTVRMYILDALDSPPPTPINPPSRFSGEAGGLLADWVGFAFDPALHPKGADGRFEAVDGASHPAIHTPAFKSWFGDWEHSPETASKVVDEAGKPLVVYHGSGHYGFNEFSSKKFPHSAGFFARDPHIAKICTNNAAPGSGVYRVFLNLKNPLDIRHLDGDTDLTFDEFADAIPFKITPAERQAVKTRYQQNSVKNPPWSWAGTAEFNAMARKAGYDGIAYQEYNADKAKVAEDERQAKLKARGISRPRPELADTGESYIAFEPTQIKSVDNAGAFDPNSRDIRFAQFKFNEAEERAADGRWAKSGEAPADKPGGDDPFDTPLRRASEELGSRVIPERPRTDDEIAKSMGFRDDCAKLAHDWANGDPGLTDDAKKLYGDSLAKCFAYMPAKNVQAVFKNMGYDPPRFHRDTDEVNAACRGYGVPVPSGRRVLGFWAWTPADPGNLGTLHLDGGSDTDPLHGGGSTHDNYAHELGHALDGHDRYSSKPGWKAAWDAEINTPEKGLSKYACTNLQEGFAEFHRLLLTQNKYARELFPKCYAFWKEQGIA